MEMLLDGYILHVAILGGECNFVNNTGQKEDFHFEVVKALKRSSSQHTQWTMHLCSKKIKNKKPISDLKS